MTIQRFANSARTVLTAPIGNNGGTDVTLNVGSFASFPAGVQYSVRVDNELMLVTAGSGTLVWTVTRGSEGTAVVAHGAGAPVVLVLTAGVMNILAVLTADQAANTVLGGPAAGGAVAPGFRALVTADFPNNSVTYAKLQDVSTTQRLLGRNTAGAGDAEEVTLSQLLDWVGSATQGDLLYRGASGWARLAAGTSGQVLQAQGPGANPQWATPLVPNVIHNGGGEVWQRGTSVSTADDTYGCDRWYSLTQIGSGTQSQQPGTTNARYAIRLNQDQATAQRMGLAQIVEAADAIPYRGRLVTLQFQVKASVSTNIRFAILEWTGTADAVTSDVVNSWTNTTYTAGQFFLGSNLTVTAVSASTAATTGFTQAVLSGTVSANCNNLIVFVWTEGAVAQNVTLTLTECNLHDGSTAQPWFPPTVQQQRAACQRFFLAVSSIYIGIAINATRPTAAISFPAEMRATPAMQNASFAPNVAPAGTPVLYTASTTGASAHNNDNNWTVNALVNFSGQFTAEL